MSENVDVYRAVEIGVYQEIVDRFLHPYWGVIAGQGQPLPAASEFERMARELVESRNGEAGPQFTLPAANGSKPVRLNEIKEQVAKLAGASRAGLLAEFSAVDDIPDKDKVHRMAAAVEHGVAKGSSWQRVFLADPLGTIVDLVVGFFTGSLSKRMGERFARSTTAAVQQELAVLRQEPGMGSLLTSERVITIGEHVADATRQAAASQGTAAPAMIRLRSDVQPLTGGDLFKPQIETAIRSLVADAFKQKNPDGKSARDTLMGGQRSAWTLGLITHGALTESDADAVEKRVADAVVKVSTDEAYRFNGKCACDLSDAELRSAVISEVTAGVRRLHEERGWSYADERVGKITEALQGRLTPDQLGKLQQASSLANGRGLAAMMPPEAQRAAGLEGQVRTDQGVSGPYDAPAVAVPTATADSHARPKVSATMGGSKGW